MHNKTKKRIGVAAMACVMLAAVGATAGTTLAKYVTSTQVTTQQATVAKWGYTLSANIDNMFAEQYGPAKTGEGPYLAKKTSSNGIVVSARSSGIKNLVAPGTTGFMTLTLNGTAEVDTVLTITIPGDANDFKTVYLKNVNGVESSSNDYVASTYYPIKWAVTQTTGEATVTPSYASTDVDEAKDIATLIANALNVDGATVKQGTDSDANKVFVKLPAKTTFTSDTKLTISWKWDFENTTNKDLYNKYDTVLGYLANGTTTGTLDWAGKALDMTKYEKELDVVVNLSATFEQVQAWPTIFNS